MGKGVRGTPRGTDGNATFERTGHIVPDDALVLGAQETDRGVTATGGSREERAAWGLM